MSASGQATRPSNTTAMVKVQHAIFWALGEQKVATSGERGALQLAVDAAVALIQATWVPGQVEMHEIAD
jgi:hypothetical protein